MQDTHARVDVSARTGKVYDAQQERPDPPRKELVLISGERVFEICDKLEWSGRSEKKFDASLIVSDQRSRLLSIHDLQCTHSFTGSSTTGI